MNFVSDLTEEHLLKIYQFTLKRMIKHIPSPVIATKGGFMGNPEIKIKFDLSNQNNGIYYLKLYNKEYVFSKIIEIVKL